MTPPRPRRRQAPSAKPAKRAGRLPRTAAAPGGGSPSERLVRALAARAPLLADPHTTVCRLVHDAADGLPGLVLEKFGDVLIAQLHQQRLALAEHVVRELCAHAAAQLRARAVYRKVFPKDRPAALAELTPHLHDPAPWLGEPVAPELLVLEEGLRFLVRAYDGYSTGLFLEHRAHRRLVRELARGRRVLNAFAYTCGFAVAAAAGGAAHVVNVDLGKRFLEWGRRNLCENGLPLENQLFIASDIFDYYRRAARQDRRYDLIVLDPPTFSRTRRPRTVWCLTRDLDRLVRGAVERLERGGRILLCTNHRGTSGARLERALRSAAAALHRRCCRIERPPRPPDFAGDPDYAKSLLAQFD